MKKKDYTGCFSYRKSKYKALYLQDLLKKIDFKTLISFFESKKAKTAQKIY
jgi:hypothetical protein